MCVLLFLYTILMYCIHSTSFFVTGDKVFSKISASAAPSYKFVRLVFQCTGGGTLVPIFINLIPVSLATDAYPIAIACSYLLHTYTPILRQVLSQSELLHVSKKRNASYKGVVVGAS